MNIAERVELAAVPVAGALVISAAPLLPSQISAGHLLLASSALLLLQGLVRDLWLLSRRRQVASDVPVRKGRCMCIESTVGAVGVMAGVLLAGWGVQGVFTMAPWQWSVLVMLVLATGFAFKDYVLEWSPWRIRRDKDHVNIVFTWKA